MYYRLELGRDPCDEILITHAHEQVEPLEDLLVNMRCKLHSQI